MASSWGASCAGGPPLDVGEGHGGHHIERAAHGYEATREAAMAAFAKSWRRRIGRPARDINWSETRLR